MKTFKVFSLLCFLTGFIFIACQRDRGVQAGNDDTTYQPAPAPPSEPPNASSSDEIKGELLRVDTRDKTISVRVESGMVQTFRFDDDTSVAGLEDQPQTNLAKPGKISNREVGNLIGRKDPKSPCSGNLATRKLQPMSTSRKSAVFGTRAIRDKDTEKVAAVGAI